MKKFGLKMTSYVLTGIMALSVLGGCSSNEKKSGTTSNAPAASPSSAQTEASVYPLKTNKTIKFMDAYTTPSDLTQNASLYPSLFKDHEFFAELGKRTGVKIQLHDVKGSDTQKVQLVFASGDLPDIMLYDWLNVYPGGPDAAIANGIIKPLNPIMDKYAPNLKKALASRPEIDKQVKTDGGKYYVFPFVRDDTGTTSLGAVARKDWLDELSMTPPTTIDEWYTMLKAFKEKKGATAAYSVEATGNTLGFLNTGGILSSAYGVMSDFYVENGKVVYGNIQPGYKEYISMLRKWYAEGLMDKDFATVDKNILATKITKGNTGATVAFVGSRIGSWLTTMKGDTKFDLVGLPTPTLKKGETPKFGHLDNAYIGGCSAAITSKCTDDEAAARLLDYLYGKEGSMLVNYGPEGFSYEMKDGKVSFKDSFKTLCANDKTTAFGATNLVGRWTNFPNMQLPTPVQYDYKQQVDAYNVWIKNDMKKYLMPPITQTPEENAQIAKIKAQVETLAKEAQIKMILGDRSIDTFDAYVNDVKKAGIDTMIQLKQQAYDRYKTR